MIIEKAIASIAVCFAGSAAMYFSKGETGIGWAILGIYIIWYSGVCDCSDKDSSDKDK